MFPPRPPIERQKSGTMDYSDAYKRKMLAWRDALNQQGIEEAQACRDLQECEKYIDFIEGTGYWGSDRPKYRSHYYDNHLADQRREKLAALSDVHPMIDVSARIPDYDKQATNASSCMRHEWVNKSMDLKLVELLDYAMFNTGFWKITANLPGEINLSAHPLGRVLPVQMDGNDIQTSAAVIYRAAKSLTYFLSTFGPELCENLHRYGLDMQAAMAPNKYQRPNSIPETQWNSLSPAMKRRMHLSRNKPGQTAVAGRAAAWPVIELQEIYAEDWTLNEFGHDVLIKNPNVPVAAHNYHYIVEPKARLFPRKRLAIFGGDDIMYDGPNPAWHGMYPYAMLTLNPVVWSPYGISVYRDLLPLVRVANRIGVGVDEATAHALNRWLVSRKGAIDPVTWDNLKPGMPGQKVMMLGMANVASDLKWMDPPTVPQYVGDFLRYLVDTIRRRSGSLDISGLARKKQAPGGDTVESMRDAMSGPLRLEGRYVEDTIRQAAIQSTSHVFQFFTLSQRLRLLGADGQTWEDYDYNAQSMVPAGAPKEDWWRMFSVNVAQGSMHGQSEFQKKQEAYVLRRSGDLSRAGLYRRIKFPEKVEQIEQEMQQEKKDGVPGGTGRVPRQTRAAKTGGV